MASLDSLPADQRAVLQLVLQRGRSYDEIAQLLSIDRAAVRERALSAFDALGPQTARPARAPRADHRLPARPAAAARQPSRRATALAESPSERAWARVVASRARRSLAKDPAARDPRPTVADPPPSRSPRARRLRAATPETAGAVARLQSRGAPAAGRRRSRPTAARE